MGLIGPYGKERNRPQGLLRPSPCWSELDKGLGGRNTPLSFSLSLPSFPLPRWNPTRTWSPSRTLPSPLAASSPLPPLYTEEGHPLETHNCPIAVCGAPISVFHLSHIFGELRRSPAGITSPSPSPRRRADGTHLLPRHLAGSRRRGTSPSCTCVELGGAVRSVLDRWSSKDCSTTSTALRDASAKRSTRVRRHTLPSRSDTSPWIDLA